MNKKVLLTVGLSFVLLLGLVALSWAAVQPRLPVAEPGAQRTVKHHMNKAEAFEIDHWDFESANGQWTPGLPGEDPHTTANRCCNPPCPPDSSWWFGIDQYNGYASDWRNYMDTDPHPVTVTTGISLQFNHLVSIEAVSPASRPPDPDDIWDVVNLQISVNDGNFMPIDPHFSGWTGYAYAGTSSYAYGVEWNIGHYYGGWVGKNPSWPVCDMSDIHIAPGDHPFHLNPEVEIHEGDVLVFRFELCSDPAYSSADGDPVEGWYVDDIVVSNDIGTYTNNGSNQGATLLMHPGNHIFPSDWEWVTSNYAPHEYTKSAIHSWWCTDATTDHNSYLVSSWIELPDTAKLVWVSHYVDQFVPGATDEGYLKDYYYWYVRSDTDMKWKELTHDYDRENDSTHCDWDVRWAFWENDSLYNGTFFVVPDKVPFGSRVQFAIKFMTDDVLQTQGKQYCNEQYEMHNGRGMFIDDFTVTGQKCYDQNMGLFWETECSRPLPLSVPAGSSWAVKALIRSMYACDPTALHAPVDFSVDPPNLFMASHNMASGYPSNLDSLFTIGTFTASQSADTAQTLACEVTLVGDDNLSDNEYTNVPEFNFFVTDSLREYMGYDDLRMKTGQRSWIPYDGVGTWFEPNYNWGGYKLVSVRWLSAYPGFTRVKIYYPITTSNTYNVLWPPTALNPIPCPVDTSLFATTAIFDTTVHVPNNDWKQITFYDDDGNVRPALRNLNGKFLVYLCWDGIDADSVGGCGFDGPETIGGHTFMSIGCNPTYFRHHCNYDTEEPWQNASMRAAVANRRWVPPPEGGVEFIRGDYNDDGSLMMNDALTMLLYLFHQPGGVASTCEDAADYNDDGNLMMNDALTELLYLFHQPGGVPPAPPGESCGIDPTEDELGCDSYTHCPAKAAKLVATVPTSVEDASNVVKVKDGYLAKDGLMVVPVELTNQAELRGFQFTLNYDPTLVTAVKVDGGDSYDFFAPWIDNEVGKVTVGIVPDMNMEEPFAAGQRVVAEISFKAKGNAGLRLSDVALYGLEAQVVDARWVDGVVKAGAGLPTEFALSQNYPNPFNPTTLIKYDLPVDCQVRLDVYNVVGQRVATLVDGQQKAGYKVATWNARDLGSGVYFYKLTAGDFTSIRKMVFLK